jgi:hypothetical protein
VSECDHEASIMRRPWPTSGCSAIGKKKLYFGITSFDVSTFECLDCDKYHCFLSREGYSASCSKFCRAGSP